MSDGLQELTLHEIRCALRAGLEDETIHQALARLSEQDEIDRRHERANLSFRSYLDARLERRAQIERKAMDELDRERDGRPWPSMEVRARARREAGLEARERFETDEPLLGFVDWVEAGAPEKYRADGAVVQAEGLLKRLSAGAT